MTERTLILVKPDGVQRLLVGRIVGRFEERGLKLVGLKLVRVSRELAEQHYAIHRERPFFGSLVDFITSSPLVALAVEGPNAIAVVRSMVGATRPNEAAPGTIRGDFALETAQNLIHASDGPETAASELALWFAPGRAPRLRPRHRPLGARPGRLTDRPQEDGDGPVVGLALPPGVGLPDGVSAPDGDGGPAVGLVASPGVGEARSGLAEPLPGAALAEASVLGMTDGSPSFGVGDPADGPGTYVSVGAPGSGAGAAAAARLSSPPPDGDPIRANETPTVSPIDRQDEHATADAVGARVLTVRHVAAQRSPTGLPVGRSPTGPLAGAGDHERRRSAHAGQGDPSVVGQRGDAAQQHEHAHRAGPQREVDELAPDIPAQQARNADRRDHDEQQAGRQERRPTCPATELRDPPRCRNGSAGRPPTRRRRS